MMRVDTFLTHNGKDLSTIHRLRVCLNLGALGSEGMLVR